MLDFLFTNSATCVQFSLQWPQFNVNLNCNDLCPYYCLVKFYTQLSLFRLTSSVMSSPSYFCVVAFASFHKWTRALSHNWPEFKNRAHLQHCFWCTCDRIFIQKPAFYSLQQGTNHPQTCPLCYGQRHASLPPATSTFLLCSVWLVLLCCSIMLDLLVSLQMEPLGDRVLVKPFGEQSVSAKELSVWS